MKRVQVPEELRLICETHAEGRGAAIDNASQGLPFSTGRLVREIGRIIQMQTDVGEIERLCTVRDWAQAQEDLLLCEQHVSGVVRSAAENGLPLARIKEAVTSGLQAAETERLS